MVFGRRGVGTPTSDMLFVIIARRLFKIALNSYQSNYKLLNKY